MTALPDRLVRARSLADGVLSFLSGACIHTGDINAAPGRPSGRGAVLQAALQCMALTPGQRGWQPAGLEPGGMTPVPVSGGGVVKGGPLTFALAASGRVPPDVTGLGATVNIFT